MHAEPRSQPIGDLHLEADQTARILRVAVDEGLATLQIAGPAQLTLALHAGEAGGGDERKDEGREHRVRTPG